MRPIKECSECGKPTRSRIGRCGYCQQGSMTPAQIEGERARCRAYRKAHWNEILAKKRAKYKVDPERAKDAWLRHNRGITLAEFKAILGRQSGVCAICRTTEWGKKGPHVDHDHATGEVRGILCCRCNTGIGNLKDDPDLISRAALYLRAHKKSRSQMGPALALRPEFSNSVSP